VTRSTIVPSCEVQTGQDEITVEIQVQGLKGRYYKLKEFLGSAKSEHKMLNQGV